MKERHFKRNLGIGVALVLLVATVIPVTVGMKGTVGPEIEISAIQGGFGKVCIEIQNIGDTVAEDVVSTISVTGGIFNRINVFQECSGCGQCNTSIPPGGMKQECTNQFIFGIGSIDIVATANATGLATVEETATGFVIGPFVIIQ